MALPSRFRWPMPAWATWGLVVCLLAASRWLLPHVTVCHPDQEARASREVTAPDGRTVRVRLANTLLWLEVDGEEVHWEIFQDDFSFVAQGKLDPDGRIFARTSNAAIVDDGSSAAMVLRKDRWGLPSSLHLDDMLCLENGFPCQPMGIASLELPLSCGPRPRWAPKGMSALDYLGVALFVVPPPFVVALGLIVGLFFSILEARVARRFTHGHWWAMAALSARVLLPVVAAGAILEALWGWSAFVWLPDDSDAGRNPFALLRLGCLGLGQLLAAGGAACRRLVSGSSFVHQRFFRPRPPAASAE